MRDNESFLEAFDNSIMIEFPTPKPWITPKGVEVLGPTNYRFNSAYFPIEKKIKV